MYLGNLSGYGTSDFNKALKGNNIAAIQKGIDVQKKQLAKSKKAKDIARNQAQLAAAEARLAQVQHDPSIPGPKKWEDMDLNWRDKLTPAKPLAPVTQIKSPPAPVASAPVTPSPVPQVAPPPPSLAPPPAAESLTPAILPAPQLVAAPPQVITIDTPSATTPETAPTADESKVPLILGVAALGVAALFMLRKKR